jgi:hypothetical protein
MRHTRTVTITRREDFKAAQTCPEHGQVAGMQKVKGRAYLVLCPEGTA